MFSNSIKKILILGSGPSIVGEIAEFDLITKQAIKSFQEEDKQVVIINPNPATVATDHDDNVTVYLEPMTKEFLKRIIRMEEPDAIVSIFGSKVGMKMAYELHEDGILEELSIKLLSLPLQTLKFTQNKYDFNTALHEAGIFVTQKQRLYPADNDLDERIEEINFPIVLKPEKYDAHLGFRHLNNSDELRTIIKEERRKELSLQNSFEVQEDLSDYTEYTIDALRDNKGQMIVLNYAENINPAGINAGDAISVSPIQTLNDHKVQVLRRYTKKIIDSLEIVGVVSVRFAVKPLTDKLRFRVIGIYPRVTRSNLLAYRTTGYNIGYILAKLVLGYTLDEITNPATNLSAAIEPVLDAVSVKIPMWSFADLGENHYLLNNKMHSSGESVGIGRNFDAALMQAILATNQVSKVLNFKFFANLSEKELIKQLSHPNENLIFVILAAFNKGFSLQDVHNYTRIHPTYLEKFARLTDLLQEILEHPFDAEVLDRAKHRGIADVIIAKLWRCSEQKIHQFRHQNQIIPSGLYVESTAGFYPTYNNAVFHAYQARNEIVPFDQAKPTILIIGLSPFQISQNSEFDYMLYNAIQEIKAKGYRTVLLTNNSESISADYQLVDRLYFEAVTLENIMEIANIESPKYVLTQFSGKIATQLLPVLHQNNLEVLGGSEEINDLVGQKQNFSQLLNELGFPGVSGLTTSHNSVAINFAEEVGYPLLIGGKRAHKVRKSAVVFEKDALEQYLKESDVSDISISKFIEGHKYEVTAISDGEQVTIPGIIEHLEQSGSHASDSIAVFNPQNLSSTHQRQIRDMTIALAKKLKARGFLNIHFLIQQDTVYVLQVKNYAGHNVAFLSKSLKRKLSQIAMKVLLGEKIKDLGFLEDIWSNNQLIHVKMPVFSRLGFTGEDIFDSVMKASGFVMGRDTELPKALYKGYEGAGLKIPSYGTVFVSVNDEDKDKAINLAQRFRRLGFKLIATEGTADYLAEQGITVRVVAKLQGGNPSLINKIIANHVNMVINTTNFSEPVNRAAIKIRDAALTHHVPVFSRLQSAEYILEVLESQALTTQPM
ncbi:carbamoyl phosphate synthase large subunit [Holzapfeliella sp. JNUCC 80]